MASSFFRGSCAIFWLTWLISLAYIFGISVYEAKYVIMTDEYLYASSIVKLVCYIVLSMSFVGCVFVKCDISHILCFLLYTLPLLIGVPCLCIFGMIITRDVESFTGDLMVKTAKEYWQTNGILPEWLEISESENKCCGVYSWKDYVLDIYNTTGTHPVPPVPSECCVQIIDNVHCLNSTITDLVVSKTNADISQTALEIETDNTVYMDRKDNVDFPFLNEKYRSAINTRGCRKFITRTGDDLKSSHFTFLVILVIFSILMAIVYIRNWCASRLPNGLRSSHSLDVEKLSLLEFTDDDHWKKLISKGAARSRGVKRVTIDVEGLGPGSLAGAGTGPGSDNVPGAVGIVPGGGTFPGGVKGPGGLKQI